MAYKIYQKLQSGMANQGLIDAKDVDGASLCYHAEQDNAAAAGAMTATVTDFKLADGTIVFFRLAFNTLAGATLNISGTGSKPLYWHGSDLRAADTFKALDTLLLQYRTESGGRYYVLGVNLDTPSESVIKDTEIGQSPSETNVPTSLAVFNLVNTLATYVEERFTTFNTAIGTLRSLATTAKNSLVEAINELFTALGNKQDALSTAQMNAVNSGITQSKRVQYDGYSSGKQNALTTAQMNAVNSGITTAKRNHYDDAYDVTYGSTHDVVSIPIITDKAWTVTESEGEFDVQLVNASGATVHAMASEPFKIASNVNLSFVAGNERQAYSFYFAVLKDGEWKVVKKFVTHVQVTVSVSPFIFDPDDVETEPSSTPSEPTVDASSIAAGAFVAQGYIGCQCRLFVIRNDGTPLTSADFNAINPQQIQITGETVQGTIKQYAVFKQIEEHSGYHYFKDKLFIGSLDQPNEARQVGMFYETRAADPTYKAKLVNGEYICAPIAMADSSYDMFVTLVQVNYFEKPTLVVSGNAIFAIPDSNFAQNGENTPVGNIVESCTEPTLLLISDIQYATYGYAGRTLSKALFDEIQARTAADTALGARIDALNYAQYARCQWTVYNTVALLESYGMHDGSNIPETNNNWFYGEIEVNATTGNQIFDLRKLSDTQIGDIQIILTALSPYETIVYYRACDDVVCGGDTPLRATDLCSVGEKPTQVAGKEYAIHVRYNEMWWEELTPITIPEEEE